MATPTDISVDDKLARLAAELAANPMLEEWHKAIDEVRRRLDRLDEEELERELEAERASASSAERNGHHGLVHSDVEAAP